jgi:hypothetical protein
MAMPAPQLGIYKDKKGGLLLSNMNEPNATPMTGSLPKLGGGGTPQSRYAEQQNQLASRSQYDQEVAAAKAQNARNVQILSAPDTSSLDSAIETALQAGQKDLSNGENRLAAKYANARLGDLLGAKSARDSLMQRGVESGLDMQKFNAGQANDLQSMREKMGFDKQSQEAQFGQQKELQNLGFGQQEKLQNAQLGSAQYIAEMKAKNYLTPYETTAQKEKAKNDALTAQEKQKFGSTMEMLNPDHSFGKNIESLIAKSTGGGIGAGVDSTLRAFDVTTPGAKAIAELTPFQNQLIMMMPRGPGAQSDRDVEIAKGMAGAIADPTKTVEERQAAYKGLKDYYGQLAMKYGYMPDKTQQGQQGQQTQQQGQYVAPDVQQQTQQPQATTGAPVGVDPEAWAAYINKYGE